MDYTDLITSQHSSAPKFMALVEAITRPLAQTTELLKTAPTIFDVNSAFGQQLDYIGLWVGLSRRVSTPINAAWFSWNTPGLGWNEANWKGPYEPSEGIVDLDDAAYNTMILNQIAANYWDGSVVAVQDLTLTGLQGFDIWVAVVDNFDMSVDVYVAGNPSAALKALIERNVIPPKTAGVRINEVHYVERPLFAIGVEETIYLAGINRGILQSITESPPLPMLSFDEDVLREGVTMAPAPVSTLGLALIGDFYNNDTTHLRTGRQDLHLQFTSPDPDEGPVAISSLYMNPDGSGNFFDGHSGDTAIGEVVSAYFELVLTGGEQLASLSFWYKAQPASGAEYTTYLSGSPTGGTPTVLPVGPPGADGFCAWTQAVIPAGCFPCDKIRFSADPNAFVIDDVEVTFI